MELTMKGDVDWFGIKLKHTDNPKGYFYLPQTLKLVVKIGGESPLIKAQFSEHGDVAITNVKPTLWQRLQMWDKGFKWIKTH